MEWKRILQVYARVFFEDATFRLPPHCLYQALKVPNDFKDFKDIKDFNVVKALVRALGTKAKRVP